jgi:flagellin-like hook-associated protein FlgL
MSSIPSNLSRAPNMLLSRITSGSIGKSQLGLLEISEQMSTGKAINSFSDDGVKAATISTLDQSLARRAQQSRNLDHADSALSALDQAMGDSSDLLNQARTIASAQVSTGSSASERSGQAVVVNSLLQSLYQIANRQGVAGYIFGGSTPGTQPVQSMLGGYRYVGQGSGLVTDIDLGQAVPITLGSPNPIGDLSVRVQGDKDLDAGVTTDTRLADLDGARGVGVKTGAITFSFAGGPATTIDLSKADTIQDVATTITNALHDYEKANNVTVLGPGGVSVSGGALHIDVAPASTGPNPTLTFTDVVGGRAAADLGLSSTSAPVAFSATTPDGNELNARLTWRTPVSSLRGIGGGLGQIKINNLGQSHVVDLSGAKTLGDVRNLIEGTGLGLRVEINADGSGINVVNETAGGSAQALSIEEVPNSDSSLDFTATRLGIRTMTTTTRIADLNDGRGVSIVDGAKDPVTGAATTSLNNDMKITLGDGRTFTVDLRPQDMSTVGDVIARINSEAQSQGIDPADFNAGLSNGSNGIVLHQNASFASAIKVEPQNNSQAADGLGLLNGTYDATTSDFRAKDPAKVRVDNIFSALIDLRDALNANDTNGITLAGENLDSLVDGVSQTRATVGGLAKRVEDGQKTQQDLTLLDTKTKSNLQDLDYTDAAIRLNQLQTQLQAGYQVTSQILSKSLLDFLSV